MQKDISNRICNLKLDVTRGKSIILDSKLRLTYCCRTTKTNDGSVNTIKTRYREYIFKILHIDKIISKNLSGDILRVYDHDSGIEDAYLPEFQCSLFIVRRTTKNDETKYAPRLALSLPRNIDVKREGIEIISDNNFYDKVRSKLLALDNSRCISVNRLNTGNIDDFGW